MDLPKLHLAEQYARGLLAPLRNDLEALERRTERQATRLRLGAGDQERLDAALRAVRAAREEVARLWMDAASAAR